MRDFHEVFQINEKSQWNKNIQVRKAMWSNFTFQDWPLWPKISVLHCCKQKQDEFFIVEIMGILAWNENFRIESMFFLLIQRKLSEFVFILMTLFDLAKDIEWHATIIGCFCFYILISARPWKLWKAVPAILFTPMINKYFSDN